MDNIGLECAHKGAELMQAEQVLHRADLPHQSGHGVRGDGVARVGVVERCDPFEHGAFGSIDRSEGQMHTVAAASLTLAGEHGVLLTATQDQACRDVKDAQRVCCVVAGMSCRGMLMHGEIVR